MPEPSELSRRERQIMDAVFALGEATVKEVVETIPSPPTAMAVRRMMHILEEKGHLRRRERGREVVYFPRQAKDKAGRHAFERVLETFFGGSLEEALAAHLHVAHDEPRVDNRRDPDVRGIDAALARQARVHARDAETLQEIEEPREQRVCVA